MKRSRNAVSSETKGKKSRRSLDSTTLICEPSGAVDVGTAADGCEVEGAGSSQVQEAEFPCSVADEDPMLLHFDRRIDFDTLDKGVDSATPVQLVVGEKPCLWESSVPAPDWKCDVSRFLHPKIVQNLSLEPFASMSDKQKELFQFLTVSYTNLTDPTSNINVMPRSRIVYSLHVMNHLLKSRALVYEHNGTLQQLSEKGQPQEEMPEFRDQGITKPKVLILVPFRESAYKVVRLLITLFSGGKKGLVANRKRFVLHYGAIAEKKKKFARTPDRPPDFDKIFRGNTDDCFKFGVQIGRKRMRIFSEFYSSDLIVASPLGLRMAMEGEKNEKLNADFLSCLEIVVLDQADIFSMQNIDHLMFIFDHMHMRPKESHGVDFTRVREVWLDEQALAGKFLCQFLTFCAVPMPEISGLLNKKSANLAGAMKVQYRPGVPAASQISVQLPQAFHRFSANSISSDADDRFEFFFENVFPNFADSQAVDQTLIFVPSYFDFVRVRNRLKSDEVSFVQICEYTSEKKVIRARDMFYNDRKKFCLYTERYHFYRRHKIKGVKHVIFYQLPMYPHFYAEVCNFVGRDAVFPTCTVVYSKFDALRLAGVLGHDRAAKVLNADQNVHMVVSE